MCSDLKLDPKIDKSITSRHSTQQRTVDLMCHQMSALQPCLLNSPIQMLILPHCHCSGDCRSDHWTLHLQDTVPWSLQYFQHNYWALQNKFLGDWICRLTSHEDGLEFFFAWKSLNPNHIYYRIENYTEKCSYLPLCWVNSPSLRYTPDVSSPSRTRLQFLGLKNWYPSVGVEPAAW